MEQEKEAEAYYGNNRKVQAEKRAVKAKLQEPLVDLSERADKPQLKGWSKARDVTANVAAITFVTVAAFTLSACIAWVGVWVWGHVL